LVGEDRADVIRTTAAAGFRWCRPRPSGRLAAMNPNANPFHLVVAGAALLVFLAFLLAYFSVIRTWIKALLSGVPVSITDVIGMRLRGSPPAMIVDALIALKFQNVPATAADVEAAYLAHPGAVSGAAELVELVEKRLKSRS
jgi:hypothetical protein